MEFKPSPLLADDPRERQEAARSTAISPQVKKGKVMAKFLGRHPRTARIVLFACFVASFALASGAGKKWS
jgi:hypothetical protein